MPKNSTEFSKEIEKLEKENEALQQQLSEAQETIASIEAGSIDALVHTDKKGLTIYTDKTADKTYRTLIEKMHEGAVTLNKEGIVLYCNSHFAQMINLPLEKVIGTKFTNFIDDDYKEHFDALEKKGWSNYVKDEIYLKADVRIVMPVLISINTIEIDNTVVLSIILTDLTARNRTQMELNLKTRQLVEKNFELESLNDELVFQNEEKEKRASELSIANKELIFQSEEKRKRTAELNTANIDIKELEELIAHKESILAILSHDLRSPLAGITGMSEYLNSHFEDMQQDEIKEMLGMLEEASKNELNMLDYLVEWARVKYASEAFSPKKIELVPYVLEVIDLLSDSINLKSIHVKNEIYENMTVFADEKMLLSIFQNLISNAIKHSRIAGEIHISAQRKDKNIIVEIRDNGIGMSEAIQEKLFTPQIESLSKERDDDKGAGIGLLLVKGFLEKNGGKIWVESTEGVGSSFYFTLPIDNPADK
nr:PAS domain-containing sensor histidine kinase [uncultured Flavobacterium sp.]